MKIGQSIKEIRTSKGLRQNELSNRIGISQAYLSGIENDNKKPSMEVLENISNSLNIPLPVMFWFGISESDVHEEKSFIYKQLKPLIDNLIKELFARE